MKVLRLLLENAGIDASTLRVLFEQDDAVAFALTVGGDDAVALWDRLRKLAPRTKRWPIILGVEDLPTQRVIRRNGRDEIMTFAHTKEILAESETIDFPAWLARRQIEQIECVRREVAAYEDDPDSEEGSYFREMLDQEVEFQGLPREPWPEDEPPTHHFAIPMRCALNDKRVTMALLPCEHGWQVPAVMKFGDWNSCPSPAMHTAALRFWQQRYGAEIACLTSEEIEMAVDRPPTTRQDALRLAKMQYHYCSDIVTHGTLSIDALAAQLLEGEGWYFCWD